MLTIKKAINFLFTYKFILLLITLVAQIFIPVFFENYYLHEALSYLFITLTLIVSFLIFKNMKRHGVFVVFACFVFLILVINWIDFFGETKAIIQIPRLLFLGILYLVIFVNIFKEFRNRKEVDLDFIFGAISAYLILGLIGSFLSVVIDIYYPGSFSFNHSVVDFQDYIYFNFVTLTTLGYGDVIPVTAQGQMHAIAVALIGQLYLTITIALIVGRYLMHAKN